MKKWILKNTGESPQFEGISPTIAGLLGSRGLETEAEVSEFFSDMPQKTYDPFLLRGMREAVDKIEDHIRRGSRICIYGDYDVDGVTASCLLFEFLTEVTKNVEIYIPSRKGEGYGLNKTAVTGLKSKGIDLLITVDCGISAYEEVALALDLDLDIIVTDHHTPGEKPLGCVTINAKQKGCPYPFKELCGCGVAYKLIQALQRDMGLDRRLILRGLDLAAIATVADIVPLKDENRTIVKYGLKRVNAKKRVGLDCLISMIGGNIASKEIGAGEIAFIIGPHINAGGRVDSAEAGLKLLLEKDRAEAERYAERLIENNNMRKSLQNEGYLKAKKSLEEGREEDFVLITGEKIHEGVAGIIAGKLKDEYNRPAMILTRNPETGVLKGTARSIDSVNLYDFLNTQSDLFVNFGGHRAACGFSIEEKNLPAFRKGLTEEFERLKASDENLLDEVLYLDGVIDLGEVTNDFGMQVEKMEPFGQANPRPVFMIEEVLISDFQLVGKEKEHCRFFLRDLKGRSVECIMFNAEERFRGQAFEGRLMDFAGRVNMNYRGGEYNVQFMPTDFRFSEK